MGLLISAYHTISPPKYGNFAQITFRVFPFTYIDKKNPEVLQCFGIFFEKIYLFIESQMRRTEMSAGLTPDIRDACPMDAGRTFDSFSAASRRSPRMVL